MAIKKPIEKLHEVIGGTMDRFSDNSASWVAIENKHFEICFVFDGGGKKLESIKVSKKIYQVVDQKIIAQIDKEKQTQNNEL
jgi:hypothetical protein